MASVIAMVGNPVIMPENTMMMIHKPWGFAGGDANDMRDYAELLDKVESVLIPAYAAKTGKSSDEIAAMLEDETWMDGSECVELGFADQVTPSLQAMACIQSKRIEDFEKMPNNIRNMITPPRNSNQRDPQQSVNQPQAQHVATQPNGADENTIRAQVIAEQKERVNGINNLFAMFGGKHSELQAQCVADMDCTVDQAKDKLLALLGKDASPSAKTTPAHSCR
ncbi:peptidase S14 ClpP [Klebsiella pneumoniae subsp. pneumoniae]|uniref:Peptidase S14 ClpP n=1 Tax=Klebsiella pneumoniae subsp. pneumoniae TaxID=72407 RepID=A0A377YYH2_KLEPN|nr:peptidase S14 ClpP [Klebsiella pneumoniae subsp. pneumoniae]